MRTTLRLLLTLLSVLSLSYLCLHTTNAAQVSKPLELIPVDIEDVPMQFRIPPSSPKTKPPTVTNITPKRLREQYSIPSISEEAEIFQDASAEHEIVKSRANKPRTSALRSGLLGDPVVTSVTDGRLYNNTLIQGEYAYYKFVAPAAKWPYPIHFTVTPLIGDPDLYVMASNSSEVLYPNVSNWTWESRNGRDYVESIIVYPTSTLACIPTETSCTYYIGVQAYSNTSYVLLVRTNSVATELSNGFPLYSQTVLRNNYTYYFFENLYVNRSIAFSVTSTFGEPELYVDDSVEFPTSENSRWRETEIGSNVVGLTQCNSPIYYIGVKGSHNRSASYTILVHSYDPDHPTDSATSLGLNYGVSDALVFETFRYYYVHFYPSHDAPFLSVIAAKRAGETDIYLNYDRSDVYNPSRFPTTTDYQYRAIGNTGDNLIHVDEPKAGIYYIGVRAKTRNSVYTIIVSAAADNTTNLNLIDGTHLPGYVPYGHHQYYQFRVYYAYSFEDLAFIVTARSGYGYLMLSDYNVHPNYSNYSSYNNSIFVYSTNQIVLSVAKGTLHTGMYYLSVYTPYTSNFSYTITANYAARISMVFDRSYTDFLSEETDQFYTLSVPYKNADAKDILVTVNSLYGRTQVYGSPNGDPSSSDYYWSSTNPSSPVQTLHIAASYCQGIPANGTCVLYFQVVAVSDTTYTIQAYVADKFTLVNADTVVTSSVAEGHYKMYQFHVDFDSTNVTITATPTSGDVSLFVSRGSYVDASNYYYDSVHDGTAVESITLPDAYPGYLYVAVYGVAESSSFSFKWTHTTPNATELTDGRPQYRYLPSTTRHFYKFVAPSEGYPYNLEFSVRPDFGDPDLYVHLQRNSSDNTLPQDGKPSTYDWYSINYLNEVETVVIRPSSTPSCFANVSTCVYYITVNSFIDTAYYITALTGESGVELLNGVVFSPSSNLAAKDYDYYFFYNQYRNQNRSIAFALTSIYGSPTIYVDDNIRSPTSENARWRETSIGSNVVGLTNCDSEYYYIGIKGSDFVFNRYQILIHSYDSNNPKASATYLSINTPVNDILVFDTIRYYYFYLSHPANVVPPELAILVSKRVGEPFLFVKYSQYYNSNNFPNTTFYDWKSTEDGSNIVSIADPPSGYYFIAVQAGGHHNTEYELAAAAQLTNTSSLTLRDGSIYPGFVRNGLYNYYNFRMPYTPTDDDELTFVVTPLHGRCGIYVSDTVALPNRTSYNWSSTTTTNEVIVLTKGNGRLHRGDYNLAVYGFGNCSYSVVASLNSRFNFNMGTTVTGYLREEGEQFLKLAVPMTDGARAFTLTVSTNWGSAYLYVSRNHDPNRGEYDYEWASDNVGAQSQTVRIPASACSSVPRNATCNFYILVFGATETNYLIHAFYSNSSRAISPGSITTGQLERDDYAFYQFVVPNDRMNISIRVTPTSGNPDLYLYRYSDVSVANYDLKSATNGVENIFFDWTTPEVQYENGVKGTWYIAVYAKSACTYSLVLTIGNQTVGIVTLANGQPIADDVIPSETRIYQFTLTKTGWPYEVSVSMNRMVGYATMVVITPDNTTVEADVHGLVDIDPTWEHACNPNSRTCLYRVRITGYSWGVDARYILTYSTGHIPVALVSGVQSSPASVAFDQYDYFMLANPTKGNDIILALNSLSGNPVMYVSVTEVFPSATKKNWTSSASTKAIALTNQQYSVYYVAVHAERSGTSDVGASYSLLARSLDPAHPELSPTYLSSGYPTLSVVNRNVYDYFLWYTYPEDGDTIDGFTVTITAKFGSPKIYMSKVVDDLSSNQWPTSAKYDYTSHSESGSGNIVINVPKSDIPNEFVEYRIGVLSSSDAEYTITLTENGGHTWIYDGYETTNYLKSREYHYYLYYLYPIFPNTSWSVSVTSTTGNARLYVSDTHTRPTTDSKSYNWSSSGTGVNTVRLTPASGNIHTGYYYIGVYCASTISDCDYSVIVSYANELTLIDGNAYESRLGASGTRNMVYTVQGVTGTGKHDVNLWELVLNTPVGNGQLYVGTNSDKRPDYTDSSSYDWSAKAESNVQRILFTEDTCDGGKKCTFFIQLYCPTSCFYQIQAASVNSAAQLVPGTPAQGIVPTYGVYKKIYRFNIPNDKENVTLTLQNKNSATLSVYPMLFVGLNNPDPSPNTTVDFSTKGDRRVQTIYFDYNSPEIVKRGGMAGNCFVTVYYDTDVGNHVEIPFVLSLQLAEAVPETLTPGLEAATSLLASQSRYYQFQITNSAKWPYDTTIILRVPNDDGSADMYINSGIELPSSSSYHWKAENVNKGDGERAVVIKSGDSNSCKPDSRPGTTYCTYTIYVFARTDSSIRISANYNSTNDPEPPVDPDRSGGGGNGGIIAAAVIIPLVAIIGGIAVYYYCCRGRSCNWSSSSSKQDDFYGSHIEMNEAGTRSSSKKPKVRGQNFNRLLDDADSDYARGGDDGGSYRPPRL